MSIVAERWPLNLIPHSCVFGRSRNDTLQVSPRSRTESLLVNDRPKWQATLTWQAIPDKDMAELRFWIDALGGHKGSVILWDFTNPYPKGGAKLANGTLAKDYNPGSGMWSSGGIKRNWLDAAGNPRNFLGYKSPVTVTPAAANACTVRLGGLFPNTLILVRGDYIQINRRLYVSAINAISDATGAVEILMTTPLLEAITASSEVFLARAGCEMRLDDQTWTVSRRAGEAFCDVSLPFVETHKNFVPRPLECYS